MSSVVERILSLMKDNEVNGLKLTSDLGLSSSAVTEWKKGKMKPSADAIIKIANYFGVSIDYLLTGEEYIAPALEPHERLLLDLLRDLPPEKREQALRLIKAL